MRSWIPHGLTPGDENRPHNLPCTDHTDHLTLDPVSLCLSLNYYSSSTPDTAASVHSIEPPRPRPAPSFASDALPRPLHTTSGFTDTSSFKTAEICASLRHQMVCYREPCRPLKQFGKAQTLKKMLGRWLDESCIVYHNARRYQYVLYRTLIGTNQLWCHKQITWSLAILIFREKTECECEIGMVSQPYIWLWLGLIYFSIESGHWERQTSRTTVRVHLWSGHMSCFSVYS